MMDVIIIILYRWSYHWPQWQFCLKKALWSDPVWGFITSTASWKQRDALLFFVFTLYLGTILWIPFISEFCVVSYRNNGRRTSTNFKILFICYENDKHFRITLDSQFSENQQVKLLHNTLPMMSVRMQKQ